MNIENLRKTITTTTEIASYKELCKILEEPVKTGNAKISQLKEWARYFDFGKKDGSRCVLVINEIYSTPLPEPIRVDDIYTPLIQTILCDYLRSPEHLSDGALIVTKRELFKICGMVNNNYVDFTLRESLLEDFQKDNCLRPEVQKWHMNEFNFRIYSRLNTILYRVLDRLKKKHYILYDDYIVISKKEDMQTIEWVASNHERNQYLNIEQNIKNEFGISFLNDYNSKAFYTEVKKRVKEMYNWDDCRKYIRINYADGFTQHNYELSKQELAEEISKNQKKMNNDVVRMFETYIQEDYRKNREEILKLKDKEFPNLVIGKRTDEMIDKWINDIDIAEKYGVKILPKDYINLQQQLIDMFIKLVIKEEMYDYERNL